MIFDDHLRRWELTPDGEPTITGTSAILPVRSTNGPPAILKVALVEEEKRGGRLMRWWSGGGAAFVLAHREDALLLERASGPASLADIAQSGGDDEASRVICNVVAKLHTARTEPPPQLPPLRHWFEPLGPAAEAQGGVLRLSAALAVRLLGWQDEATVLHGDIHHGNILDFGPRGWLAIDPKGLIGDRYFDYANLFCNPDASTALAHARLKRQVDIVSKAADLSPTRLLDWIVAWAGLSAAFSLQDGDSPDDALKLAELAAAERGR